jgi:N utilization substance protein A
MAIGPITARTEFAAALNQICSERGIDPEVVLETMRVAILAAYRKDYGKAESDLTVKLDPATGEVAILKGKKDMTPPGFGRIATQTAKQVILQGIREAEKTAILAEFEEKVKTLVNGMVLRRDGQNIVVDLGRAEGLLPPSEQARGEVYRLNQRFKFYVTEIRESFKGRQIIISRAHKGLVEGLFAQEVPEVASGVVEIREVAREAGSRVKVAVHSTQPGIDPVGSCVGRQGVRVQAVISELGGQEKIDIVQFNPDPVKFIASALSPATNLMVTINEKKKIAQVIAPDDQLSLAIGKEGQNVRLAAKLTGFKIDIKGAGEAVKKPKRIKMAKEEFIKLGLSLRVLKALMAAKITTVAKLRKLSDEEILAIPGLGEKALEELRSKLA